MFYINIYFLNAWPPVVGGADQRYMGVVPCKYQNNILENENFNPTNELARKGALNLYVHLYFDVLLHSLKIEEHTSRVIYTVTQWSFCDDNDMS